MPCHLGYFLSCHWFEWKRFGNSSADVYCAALFGVIVRVLQLIRILQWFPRQQSESLLPFLVPIKRRIQLVHVLPSLPPLLPNSTEPQLRLRIKARLLISLPRRGVLPALILIDLPPRQRPRIPLPIPTQGHLGRVPIQQNRAIRRNRPFVRAEIRIHGIKPGKHGFQQVAEFEHGRGEWFEVFEAFELVGVLAVFGGAVADKVVVEPPGLFELEEDAVGGGEFFGGEVEDEAGVDVVEGVEVGLGLLFHD